MLADVKPSRTPSFYHVVWHIGTPYAAYRYTLANSTIQEVPRTIPSEAGDLVVALEISSYPSIAETLHLQ